MLISEEHSTTVNNRLAWTAIDCQFSLGPWSSLCPQLRSKQRHFLKKIKKKLPEQLYDQHITYGYIMLTAYFKHIFS